MPSPDTDATVRAMAFAFLDQQRRLHGDVLPWGVLTAGFTFDGRRVPLRWFRASPDGGGEI
jgi:hypothetical protein